MEARILTIEDRVKSDWWVVGPSDFRVRDGGAIDPRIVITDPNTSLYCLDLAKRQALFVETPHDGDLSRAPFLYRAQYETALRLIQVPYETLHRLAAEVVIDPSRLILIYSVGRCGSTLVSHAYNAVEGVESLSEPDVFTQMLGAWGADHLCGTESAELLRSCTLLQCAPGRIRGATAWALKFRSMVTEMGQLFYSIFPEARVVFLYRAVEPWARSMRRISRIVDPTAQSPLGDNRGRFCRTMRELGARETVSTLEWLAWMWRAVMESCIAMQDHGVPMFVARYEELSASPREVIEALFAYCGLSAHALSNLDAILNEDSQAGSAFSRAVGAENPVHLLPEHLDEIRRLIDGGSTGLTADTILAGTYFPR